MMSGNLEGIHSISRAIDSAELTFLPHNRPLAAFKRKKQLDHQRKNSELAYQLRDAMQAGD